jgi:DNA-binding Lrp family transcriptional regulator
MSEHNRHWHLHLPALPLHLPSAGDITFGLQEAVGQSFRETQDFTTNEIAERVHITPMAVKMRIMKLKQKRGIRTHAALLCKIATTFIL